MSTHSEEKNSEKENSEEKFSEKKINKLLVKLLAALRKVSNLKKKQEIIQEFELFSHILKNFKVYDILCFFELFKANNLYHYIEIFLKN